MCNKNKQDENLVVFREHAFDCEQRYHSCSCGYEAHLENECVPLSEVLKFVSNWWADEAGQIVMSPTDAANYIERQFSKASLQFNGKHPR